MAHTILPIVYGERKTGRRLLTLWGHAAGTLFGALAIAAIAIVTVWNIRSNVLLWSNRASGMLALGSAMVALSLREVGLCPIPIPESNWQVPRRWLGQMPVPFAAFLYGCALGMGVLTRIGSSAFYVVLAWVAFSARLEAGMATMAIYGVGRLTPLILLRRTARDCFDLGQCLVVLGRLELIMRSVSGMILAAAGGWLVAAAIVSG